MAADERRLEMIRAGQARARKQVQKKSMVMKVENGSMKRVKKMFIVA